MLTKTGNPKNACMGGYGKSLDVKITNKCNCSCNHCIEKMVIAQTVFLFQNSSKPLVKPK